MNLIRVMPAKGQDIVAISIFLAKLIGPVLPVIGIALWTHGEVYRGLAGKFLNSPALIFLSGLVTLPTGLAVALTHNVSAIVCKTSPAMGA